MCGIAGILSFDGQVCVEHLLNMSNSQRHRGPDDSGTWISARGNVGLAHVRLAIIDLSPGGRQPMTDEAEQLQIVFNGEIYNHLEIRSQLKSKGHRFRSSSDTEVILAAYRQWGFDCLSQLNGMFAFALYDDSSGQLFLARDRAGEKPLYFWHDKNSFTFASELQALFVDPGTSRSIDLEALNGYLAYGYVMGSKCILRGPEKLPPGCAMVIDVESGYKRQWAYWEIPTAPSPIPEKSLAETATELIKDSTRLRLIADVPVGIMLSGGTDSSLIAALGAAVSPTPIKTFTVAFPGHSIDESKYARLVAQHLGTEHYELEARPASMDVLLHLAQRTGEPLADASMIPVYELSKLIRQHVTVALGGDGGDELFGGYPHYSWLQRISGMRSSIPKYGRTVASNVGKLLPIGVRGRQHLIGLGGDLDESVVSINQLFDIGARRGLLQSSEVTAAPECSKRRLSELERSPLRKASLVDFKTFLVDDILVKGDRASMLNSLELRAPFLDHRLIEFAFGGLPDAQRSNGPELKVLLRKIVGPYMPRQLDLKRKQGFFLPLSAWFKGDWGTFVRDVLLDRKQDLFNRKLVGRLIDGQSRGLSNGPRLYALTMFELWRRHNMARL
jgi:asparagine synthase (glutamine-hydrolysing)